jgi:hypothetical protein
LLLLESAVVCEVRLCFWTSSEFQWLSLAHVQLFGPEHVGSGLFWNAENYKGKYRKNASKLRDV